MTDRLIELAKAAMRESVAYHTAIERSRYDAWTKTPAKGRGKYEPALDRQSLCDTLDDLFDAAVAKVREAAKSHAE